MAPYIMSLLREVKTEHRYIKRMLRMAFDAVLVMDKLAGYANADLHTKLISKYGIYFKGLEFDDDTSHFIEITVRNRILEEKPENSYLIRRCAKTWFPNIFS